MPDDKTIVTRVTPVSGSPITVEAKPGRSTSEFLVVVLTAVMAMVDQARLYLESNGAPSLVGLGFAIAGGLYALARAKVKAAPPM